MKSRLSKWTGNKSDTFDGFWEQMKKDFLTKQEN
jgi:hypothetical protein